ncbi:MAG: hypothetical protein ACRC7S_15560 [Cetobacterium sp.]
MFKVKRFFVKMYISSLRKEIEELDFKIGDIEEYLNCKEVPWSQEQFLLHDHSRLQFRQDCIIKKIKRLEERYAL